MGDVERDKRIEAVEKVLGEPFGLEFGDAAQKARRNLLLAAVVASGFWHFGLRLGHAPTVLGFQVENLGNRQFGWGLFWIVLYLELHFAFLSWECGREWRLRLTGRRPGALFGGGLSGDRNADLMTDPRQSTLYGWWLTQRQQVERLAALLTQSEEALQRLRREPEGIASAPDETRKSLDTLAGAVSQLKDAYSQALKLIEDPRIHVSLKRFDKKFWAHQSSQWLRWSVLDCLLPLVLGLYALYASCSLAQSQTFPDRPAGALRLTCSPERA
jgi:hypothetical protein